MLILEDPLKFMIDPVVFNLCTLYDLSFAPEMSMIKKKVLQKVSTMVHIEDINWRSFRI